MDSRGRESFCRHRDLPSPSPAMNTSTLDHCSTSPAEPTTPPTTAAPAAMTTCAPPGRATTPRPALVPRMAPAPSCGRAMHINLSPRGRSRVARHASAITKPQAGCLGRTLSVPVRAGTRQPALSHGHIADRTRFSHDRQRHFARSVAIPMAWEKRSVKPSAHRRAIPAPSSPSKMNDGGALFTPVAGEPPGKSWTARAYGPWRGNSVCPGCATGLGAPMGARLALRCYLRRSRARLCWPWPAPTAGKCGGGVVVTILINEASQVRPVSGGERAQLAQEALRVLPVVGVAAGALP
jgi:hypothetical protein